MEYGDFHGHKAIVLKNEHFRLECLAQAGPRIVRLIPHWMGENLFAEVPKVSTRTPAGEYFFLGGHRFWYAPESLSQTYVPDGHGITIKQVQDGIRLIGMDEPRTGIRKTVTLQVSPKRPFVIIKHKLQNLGKQSIELAPWALTMMRPGGVAILPQQQGNVDADGLLPNRRFVLWPYTRWDDSRLQLEDDYILVKSENSENPFKVGYFNSHGWLGYVFEDTFFLKRFGVRRDRTYADYGCNAEVYTNHRTTELESLGALVALQPGEDVVHTETWEVYQDTEIPQDLFGEKSLEAILKPAAAQGAGV